MFDREYYILYCMLLKSGHLGALRSTNYCWTQQLVDMSSTILILHC